MNSKYVYIYTYLYIYVALICIAYSKVLREACKLHSHLAQSEAFDWLPLNER